MELSTIFKGVVANRMKKLSKLTNLKHAEREKEFLRSIADNMGSLKIVTVSAHGNFTTAILEWNEWHFIGVAKRNPKDMSNATRGQYLAVSRAVHNALDTLM